MAGLLEKNRDTFGTDLKELIAQSSNAFLLNLFTKNSLDSNKKSMTLSLQFKTSLDELMKTLHTCNPFFVRCVKPNDYKAPNHFDDELCVRQLRYSGMLETARIRAMGYPIRHSFREFVHRYRLLVPHIVTTTTSMTDYRELTKKMCVSLLKSNPHYQLGQSKVFLKYDQDSHLEAERERAYLQHVLIIQRFARRVLFQRRLQRRRLAARTIQRNWRAFVARQKQIALNNAIERLQARLMARRQQHAYRQLKKHVVQFQAQCRGHLARKAFHAKKVQIQRQKLEMQRRRQSDGAHLLAAAARRCNHIHPNNITSPSPATLRLSHAERLERQREIEVIDDVFDFLKYEKIDSEKRKTSNVSKMILNFEAESRIKKTIPTKLLSRPVNIYSYETYESRL